MSYAKAKAKHDSTSGGGEGEGAKPRQLFCAAHGCPNLWSTSDGHVCRWHADAPKERWPEVTEQQQWDETERACLRGEPKPYVAPLSLAEKRAILTRLAQVFDAKRDPKEWAKRLRSRHRKGEKLHGTVLSMARAALAIRTEGDEA